MEDGESTMDANRLTEMELDRVNMVVGKPFAIHLGLSSIAVGYLAAMDVGKSETMKLYHIECLPDICKMQYTLG